MANVTPEKLPVRTLKNVTLGHKHKDLFKISILSILLFLWAVPEGRSQRVPSPTYETPAGLLEARETVAVDSSGRERVLYSASYAILLGNSRYTNSAWSPLRSVPNDLNALRVALERNGFHVIVYQDLDGAATEGVLDRFMRQYGYDSDHRIFVFYAGHGITLADRINEIQSRTVGYLVPIDAPRLDPLDTRSRQQFIGSAVRLSRFVDWARSIEVKHAMFVFDSCFSGSILGHRGGSGSRTSESRIRPRDYIFSDVVNMRVREFLTSGSAEQTVPAESKFADLLTQVLNGSVDEADQNGDGFITGRELINYITPWTNIYSPGQTPESGRVLDPLLDRGEILFQLPRRDRGLVEGRPAVDMAVRVAPGQVVRTVETSGPVPATGQQFGTPFVAETYITTANHHCAKNCAGEPTRTGYQVTLQLPVGAPPGARLSMPTLQCVSGAGCGGWFQVVQQPQISEDGRVATSYVEVWSTPTTWRLRSNVVVPGATGWSQQIPNQPSGNLGPGTAATTLPVTAPIQALDTLQTSRLQTLLASLENENRTVRETARQELAREIGQNNLVAANVIRRVPQGSYRYQLGVAAALARAPGGWTSPEGATSREILAAVSQRTPDPTLRQNIEQALAKERR